METSSNEPAGPAAENITASFSGDMVGDTDLQRVIMFTYAKAFEMTHHPEGDCPIVEEIFESIRSACC